MTPSRTSETGTNSWVDLLLTREDEDDVVSDIDYSDEGIFCGAYRRDEIHGFLGPFSVSLISGACGDAFIDVQTPRELM